jgi:RNA polymerase sigma-70 factor, ECF subfamily
VSVVAEDVISEALGTGTFTRRPSASRESFAHALTREYPGMITLLLRHTSDPQLAADILQDAIVTTLAKLDQGIVSPTPVIAGYVFRTALNHLRNHRRQERPRTGDCAAVDEPACKVASLEDQMQRDANVRAVRRVLLGLGSFRDREVLVRFYLQEESKQDICAALGLNEHDFRIVMHRARERLRRQLESVGLGRAELLSLLTVISMLTLVR